MDNSYNKNSLLNEQNNNVKGEDINKVEWINYFNEGLIVESINNQINNSLNTNKRIQNLKSDKNHNTYTYTYNQSNYNKNINNSNNINQEIIRTKETIINEDLYENKNYYFSNIKELYGPKKIMSFEYDENIIYDDYSDKFNLINDNNKFNNNIIGGDDDDDGDGFGNRKYKNVIVINNDNNNKDRDKNKDKGKLRGKKNIKDDDNDNNLRNKKPKNKNKSVDLKDNNRDNDNNNPRKKNGHDSKNLSEKKYYRNKFNNMPEESSKNYPYPYNKTNDNKNKNNYKNDHKFNYRTRYDFEPSYAKRHKLKKEYKIDGHFHPNEEKPTYIDKEILLGRTLPEMIVLNNYGMVSDDDYEMYQKILNYNKTHRHIRNDRVYHLNNTNNNSGNYINNTDIGKSNNIQQSSNDNKNKDNIIHTSYL